MKKKLLIICVMSFLLCFLMCGCSKNNGEEVVEELKNLDSYSCNITMKIQNDKQTINYKGNEFYDKKYGYRFELGKDRIMIYKNNNIFVKDLKNGLKYSTDKNFDSIFKLSFIGECLGLIYNDEKIKISFKNINDEKYEIIGLDIPGNNKNISKADLYINVKNNNPKYLIIYDSQNKERVKSEYNNFQFNPKLNKDLFTIQ